MSADDRSPAQGVPGEGPIDGAACDPPVGPRAVALLSGGLDSLLAARTIALQGVELTAITFATDFGCGNGASGGCGTDTRGLDLGFDIKFCHLGEAYIDLVRRPRFGYGKQLNPCIDCRQLMLTEAWEYARAIDAGWLVTGEVLAQRPMSQKRAVMTDVDRRLGLTGRVLRPLSALLLPPTLPERASVVDRARLHRFHGRNRKPQLALARRLGIADYPTPGGGCLLTNADYAARVRDLFHFAPADRNPTPTEVRALRWGRSFRLSPTLKFVVGRSAADNAALAGLARPIDWLLEPRDTGAPTALVLGDAGDDLVAALTGIAEVAASYARGPAGAAVAFAVRGPAGPTRLEVAKPASRERFEALRVS